MWRRIAGSAIVVLVGLPAALAGGPVFASLMIALGAAGYREYVRLGTRVSPGTGTFALPGYCGVVALGLVAFTGAGEPMLFAVLAVLVAASLALALPRSMTPGTFSNWAVASAGALYLGLPVYGAIALRSVPGPVESRWLSDAARQFSLGWDSAPRGLAWTLVVILATWFGDSAAYLTGRAAGRRKLAPLLSPGKTIEGAIGGLAGSMLVAILVFPAFGLGPWWLGMVIGGLIGAAGQIGDLAESLMKRQAGVKDSGKLIPGHGGVLDRMDALLFAFPAGLILVATLNWLDI